MIIDFPKLQQIPALRELWKEAFGDTDEFLDVFFSTAFATSRALCGVIDGELACALYWFCCDGQSGERFAYIYAVATAETFRGQGLCRKLIARANELLKAQGFVGSVVVPSSGKLFELYAKMGYKTFGYVDEITVQAGEHRAQLCQIDKTEYARLRRELLPSGGIIQERENLDFFQRQVEFYAGADFVMAGRVTDKKFCCAELLGNTDKLAETVASLDCKEGIFRTVGNSKPFAMYYGEVPIPSFFGLAFD